jgi:hypothetical protein
MHHLARFGIGVNVDFKDYGTAKTRELHQETQKGANGIDHRLHPEPLMIF